MKSLQLSVSLLLLLSGLAGCKNESGQEYRTGSSSKTQLGKVMREQAKIITSYDDAEIEDIPAVVQFNDEQRKYVIELLSAVLRVIEGTSDLESEESKIFGEGKFYWPKDPTKPIKTERYYTHDNFRMRGISLWLDRKDERSKWKKARLTVPPRNFPQGVYDMGLPSSIFRDFQLMKSVQETRKDESIYKPVVFYFSHKEIRDLTLKVEARSDVASVDTPYPSTFHRIEITRGSP